VLTSNRFGFEPEITARLAQARARIYEMPAYPEKVKAGLDLIASGKKAITPGGRWGMPSISEGRRRIVFVSLRPGLDFNLWTQLFEEGKPVGSPTVIAALDGTPSMPAISPDGRWIACYRILAQKREIMTVSIMGKSMMVGMR
jgi:Tol biopolymer transport system component